MEASQNFAQLQPLSIAAGVGHSNLGGGGSLGSLFFWMFVQIKEIQLLPPLLPPPQSPRWSSSVGNKWFVLWHRHKEHKGALRGRDGPAAAPVGWAGGWCGASAPGPAGPTGTAGSAAGPQRCCSDTVPEPRRENTMVTLIRIQVATGRDPLTHRQGNAVSTRARFHGYIWVSGW